MDYAMEHALMSDIYDDMIVNFYVATEAEAGGQNIFQKIGGAISGLIKLIKETADKIIAKIVAFFKGSKASDELAQSVAIRPDKDRSALPIYEKLTYFVTQFIMKSKLAVTKTRTVVSAFDVSTGHVKDMNSFHASMRGVDEVTPLVDESDDKLETIRNLAREIHQKNPDGKQVGILKVCDKSKSYKSLMEFKDEAQALSTACDNLTKGPGVKFLEAGGTVQWGDEQREAFKNASKAMMKVNTNIGNFLAMKVPANTAAA